jgi:cell division protein FtsQ
MSATGAGSVSRRLAQALRRRRPRAGGMRLALSAPRPRTLLAAGLALALLLVGWLWLRDASLVAVRDVEISGVGRDGQGARIRAALEEAARSMTTLHVRRDALDTAAAPYSVVKRIEVATGFPHAMRIHVVTNVAVGAISVEGRRIAVTSDGTLLRDVTAPAALPEIPLHAAPAGSRLTEPAAVAAVSALGAAPGALRARVEGVVTTPEHGLTIQLAHGPVLWFGDGERLAAKWAAAATVLADPEAAGASSIDVSAPERPAVAGLPDGAPLTGESDLPELPEGATAIDPATAPPATTDPAATVDPSAALP